jgi:Natural resistance-associated macrophage protein
MAEMTKLHNEINSQRASMRAQVAKEPAKAKSSPGQARKPRSPTVAPSKPRLQGILGPGLITGASDDDPSGIATYSQAGAQFGFAVTWTLLFTYPLMTVIQEISALRRGGS